MISSDPIRVFVGCAPNGEDAESQAVLEYTLRSRASRSVDLVWMKLSRDPASFWYSDGAHVGWRTETWSTPFTGFRWAIPAYCGYQGRAIYMDSDTIARADIAALFDQPMAPGRVIKARGVEGKVRYCVMLIDCAQAQKHFSPLNEIKGDPHSAKRMTAFMRSRPDLAEKFDGNWNCIDGDGIASLDDPSIKIIHYSRMNNQPHLKHALPRLAAAGQKHWFDGEVAPHWRADMIELFDAELTAAEAAGYRVADYAALPHFGSFRKKSYRGSFAA